MDEIVVFDIASLYNNGNPDKAWYTQKASGDVPPSRTDHCIVGIAAPDNSSYNIYMYAGRGNADYFDDIYVLSLPSFTWTRTFLGQGTRYGHTCHVVGNRQMITVGG
jgi:hypothetical protein